MNIYNKKNLDLIKFPIIIKITELSIIARLNKYFYFNKISKNFEIFLFYLIILISNLIYASFYSLILKFKTL